MGIELRILIAEDVPIDAELVHCIINSTSIHGN